MRTFNYDRLLTLGPLTDKRIEHYELQGHYGEQRRLQALKRVKRKVHKRVPIAQQLLTYA